MEEGCGPWDTSQTFGCLPGFGNLAMLLEVDARTRDFYRLAMTLLNEAQIPYLVGGAYALERYTGVDRHTKDLDVFVRPRDASGVFELFSRPGV